MRRAPGAATVLAVALLVAAPLAPGVLATGSPAALVRIPVESLVVVLLLALLPWRAVRRSVAVVYGMVVVAALLLAGIDTGYESILDTHFDPSEWRQLGDAFGVVADSIGVVPAALLAVLAAFAALALVVVLAWAALRTDAAIRRHLVRGTAVATTVTAVWVVGALAGSQLVAGEPAAAAASVDTIASAAGRAGDTARAQADLAERVRDDPYAAAPASDLLTRLKGKDVIFAFVESYGQVAVQDTSFSGGVDRTLRGGETQLAAEDITRRARG
ncbi:hypothetical protein GCM10025881_23740 [Pseudolysinimonas kribbensis]|uniref:Sulfatase n=1 Tax=Pseudolysinimonas kribbensis TaxID=433641 RepID=A0ABQ6K4J2_9MICO|nr:hypothetical protein [Pseudolysinimonas kribbensis]GMA95550.1 hypothetical protein GCM10025881_23740 [Pseudolysinimonas kribbensis]